MQLRSFRFVLQICHCMRKERKTEWGALQSTLKCLTLSMDSGVWMLGGESEGHSRGGGESLSLTLPFSLCLSDLLLKKTDWDPWSVKTGNWTDGETVVQTQVPLVQQQLLFNGKEVQNTMRLNAAGVGEDDLLMLVSAPTPSRYTIIVIELWSQPGGLFTYAAGELNLIASERSARCHDCDRK